MPSEAPGAAPQAPPLRERLIFEYSRAGRGARAQWPRPEGAAEQDASPLPPLPEALRRRRRPMLPEASELDVVRHFTRLSQLNFSVDTHFYPLGSCTMKYNPKACHAAASLPGFLELHPLAPPQHAQGLLACLYELQELLKAVTGMHAMALSPLAGAHAELCGLAMIRAYHRSRAEPQRDQVIVPQAAHGTNPASASLCGCSVREIAVDAEGDIDLEALRAAVGPHTAAIMLTNPSTLGVYERRIEQVARLVHEAGALLYYDGANLNAMLGRMRPGEMGFDVAHFNLHKTFATPHGSGGPGAGALGAGARLAPFLPTPMVAREEPPAAARYRWLTAHDRPLSIGRVAGFAGNTGVLLRAYAYLRMLGRDGVQRVGEYATLNANYLLARLRQIGYEAAYPSRRASHEFALTLRRQAREQGVTAADVAKRLLDLGFHAPTTYFPLMIEECLLIEPTETESKETLDAFTAAMAQILREAHESPETLRRAPHSLPVRRLDDVRAAREPDLAYARVPG